ncbi:hypothetical protein TNCV_2402841 [Trichonephila clavipes]|nr:hypothetical protein TNCV_2402841 [Trichonephila clavipes]
MLATIDRGRSRCPRNTNTCNNRAIIRVLTNNATRIDAMSFITFQTSSGIKGNHSETAGGAVPILNRDQRIRVQRWLGYRSIPIFVIRKHTMITQDMIGWEVICWDTQSSLSVFPSPLTAHSSVVEILASAVLPVLSCHPADICQQNNTRPLSQKCLQGYDVLPLPT